MGRAPARILAAVSALVVGSSACEVLVPGDLPPYACQGSDPSSCPAGQYCDGARCIPCDVQHCGADAGGDVAVGDTGIGGDSGSEADAPLDGDAQTMDAPPNDGAGCSGGALGCPCAANTDCASHICGVADVLSSSFTNMAGAVCTQTCCTSSDCAAGFVCYGAGTGGSYCVAAAVLSRPAVPNGAGPGGGCNAPTDCRSGVCSSGHCVDTCCADSQCASPTTCALTPSIDGHTSFVCVVHAGTADRGSCSASGSCASGVCSYQTCRPHCCGIASAMTSGYHSCALDAVGPDVYAYADFPTSDPTGGDFGAACTTDDQCKSRACNTTAGTCSDVCCVDADCAGYGALVCRPDQKGPSPLTTLHLLCVTGP